MHHSLQKVDEPMLKHNVRPISNRNNHATFSESVLRRLHDYLQLLMGHQVGVYIEDFRQRGERIKFGYKESQIAWPQCVFAY